MEDIILFRLQAMRRFGCMLIILAITLTVCVRACCQSRVFDFNAVFAFVVPDSAHLGGPASVDVYHTKILVSVKDSLIVVGSQDEGKQKIVQRVLWQGPVGLGTRDRIDGWVDGWQWVTNMGQWWLVVCRDGSRRMVWVSVGMRMEFFEYYPELFKIRLDINR